MFVAAVACKLVLRGKEDNVGDDDRRGLREEDGHSGRIGDTLAGGILVAYEKECRQFQEDISAPNLLSSWEWRLRGRSVIYY